MDFPWYKRAMWASARLCYFAYMSFAMVTVVGGHLTAPLMSWYIFGDWRFWRYWNSGKRLQWFAYRMLPDILRGTNKGFLLNVPLSSPPSTSVNPTVTAINPTWEHGSSCGPCSACCTRIRCPVHDAETGLCLGYNSFTWRYFNCGRYPTHQFELDFYGCQKWLVKPAPRKRI